MAADDKTMFEIYRDTEYDRGYSCIFYTELEEHAREAEIAKAAAGETVISGFIADDRKEKARAIILEIVDELNDLDDDDEPPPPETLRRRLAPYLLPGD